MINGSHMSLLLHVGASVNSGCLWEFSHFSTVWSLFCTNLIHLESFFIFGFAQLSALAHGHMNLFRMIWGGECTIVSLTPMFRVNVGALVYSKAKGLEKLPYSIFYLLTILLHKFLVIFLMN